MKIMSQISSKCKK